MPTINDTGKEALCNYWEKISIFSFSHNILKPINPFPHDKFQTLPNLREFANDNFKFDENGRKFSRWV